MGLQFRRILFSFRGRLARGAFWSAALAIGCVFVVLLVFLEATTARSNSQPR